MNSIINLITIMKYIKNINLFFLIFFSIKDQNHIEFFIFIFL